MPEVDTEVSRLCRSARKCTRTGKEHEPFQNQIAQERVQAFDTLGSKEYPAEFCKVLARVLLMNVRRRNLIDFKYSFIEIFSGPHAPLTLAVREEVQRINLQIFHNSQKILPVPSKTSGSYKEPSLAQRASMAAGWQPRWNPAYQRIPEGVCDECKHVKLTQWYTVNDWGASFQQHQLDER